MFFQTKGKTASTRDLYDQMREIVTECLTRELPEHSLRNHLLFTANMKLEGLQEAKEKHRHFINVSTSSGRFHQERYTKLSEKHHQLYRLTRGYMYLCDPREREHFNHHFRLSSTTINNCYEQFITRHAFCFTPEDESAFFHGLKEEIIPMLCQIE
ncbi:hypothetical protein [Lysinibacillus odysseyi]|uniref:Uncharacterized protein n=1 Tax=Lysinibacillus odysseyi 34hs-1 = NBRC 100172 TaxID=1220589 RepID=A0A0A3IDF0_9BACI|nr:hypothetical protein [Lysinibacillus odysseyi]KGR81510.1 hypothetical protein CD32_19325 [Lysinibacillus odysseyi 34hs-1 = NBRC 100172]